MAMRTDMPPPHVQHDSMVGYRHSALDRPGRHHSSGVIFVLGHPSTTHIGSRCVLRLLAVDRNRGGGGRLAEFGVRRTLWPGYLRDLWARRPTKELDDH